MRLIDEKKYIKKNYLRKMAMCEPQYTMETKKDVETLMRLIEDAPLVDAVVVVRCYQCQHWKKDVAGCTDLDFIGRCELANYFIGATGFCVYGERREEE